MISIFDDNNKNLVISLIISISVIAVAILLPLMYNPSYPQQSNWHKVFCSTLKQQIQYDKHHSLFIPRSITEQEISNYDYSCIRY